MYHMQQNVFGLYSHIQELIIYDFIVYGWTKTINLNNIFEMTKRELPELCQN